MFKRFIIWLSGHHIELCEGCGGLYRASKGHATDDDVTLCLLCWMEDPDCHVNLDD